MNDVCMDVEIGEKYEHKDHVTGQQVLSPAREIAVEAERINAVTERDAELDLELNDQTLKYLFSKSTGSARLNTQVFRKKKK